MLLDAARNITGTAACRAGARGALISVCVAAICREPVKFFAPMGAAALPFVLGRLKRNADITHGIGDPVGALGAIYTDTILHDVRVLKFVVEMMGTERLMMGSDMPFPIGDSDPTKIVADAGLPKEQAASINGGLAARLLNIS